MKRRITLSIALVLSVVLLSLMSSDSTANAAPPPRGSFDTGVVTPGSGQTVRMTIVNRSNRTTNVRFARREYSEGACIQGVCKHTAGSPIPSDPISLAPGEAASMDMAAGTLWGVRGAAYVWEADGDYHLVIMQVLDGAGTVMSWAELHPLL